MGLPAPARGINFMKENTSIIVGVLLEEYQRLKERENVYKNQPEILKKIILNKEFIEKSFLANGLDIEKMLFEQWERTRWSIPPKKFSHP